MRAAQHCGEQQPAGFNAVLEREGLVDRRPGPPGRPGSYVLTEAGEALTPVVWAMGHWAAEWVFGDPTEEDCDGLWLLWRLHQHAVPAKLPADRTVVHVVLTGPGAAEGWLVVDRSGVTVCRDDQGHDVDLAVEADTGQMHRWLVGLAPFRELLTEGYIRLLGPSRLARAFPGWFDMTLFAEGLRRAEQRRAANARASRRPEREQVLATVGGAAGGGQTRSGVETRPDSVRAAAC